VAAGRAALPGWRRTPAGERGELLHGVAAWLRDRTGGLGRLMTLEGASRWSRTPTKMSGNARELGPEGLESFRETMHVHLDARAERKPWWYPYGQEG
jgi:acyl-CoA reductase-like NAD-dependent aldehyde dehydrogenase